MTEEPNNGMHFGIHASIVFQLGQDLITDEVQAIVELVKNAYDADASYVKIIIDSDNAPQNNTNFPNARGYVSIEDNGSGMTPEVIRAGWLTISNSLKRVQKRIGLTTERGRTPLGDKGLGRLGIQRLGHNVDIFTRPSHSPVEYHIGFTWRDFSGDVLLEEINIHLDEMSPQRTRGTTILVSDLFDSTVWVGEMAVSRFRVALSRMISPYEQIKDFTISLVINGKRLDLTEFTRQVRQAAQVHYDFSFDGKILEVRGRVKIEFFRGNKKEQQLYSSLIESDLGDAFFTYLVNLPQSSSFNLVRSQEDGWFAEFSRSVPLNSLDRIPLLEEDGIRVVANPGAFHGEIDGFDLGPETSGELVQNDIFNRMAEYRKYIKDVSGIRVYRDGFGINIDHDWLNIGGGATSARSIYSLKANNTIGYITLTAKDNAKLEETTNREDFKRNPYYYSFYELLQSCLRFSDQAQSFLRRSFVRYQESRMATAASVASTATTEELAAQVHEKVAQATTSVAVVEDLKREIQATVDEVQASLNTVQANFESDTNELSDLNEQRVADLLRIVEERASNISSMLTKVEHFVREINALKGHVTIPVSRLLAL